MHDSIQNRDMNRFIITASYFVIYFVILKNSSLCGYNIACNSVP